MTAILEHPLVEDGVKLTNEQLSHLFNGEEGLRRYSLDGVVLHRVGYLRISSDKGKEKGRGGAGKGVKDQHFEISERAKRDGGGPIEYWYVDNDLSGSGARYRPDYERLLADVRTGKVVGRIDTWHQDRITRSPEETEYIGALSAERGIRIDTVSGGLLDFTSANGKLNARVLGAVGAHYIDHMLENQTKTFNRKRAAGEPHSGQKSYGYTIGGMELEPAEAKAIRWAATFVLDGGTLVDVARKWNDELGLRRAASGKRFSTFVIKSILTRPKIAGLMVHRGVVVGVGGWPAIIQPEELRALTVLLTNPNRGTGRYQKARWLGSNLYRCGAAGCAGRLIIAGNTNGVPCYGCRSKRHDSDIPRVPGLHASRRAPLLDETIGKLVVAKMSDPRVTQALTVRADNPDVAGLHTEKALVEEQIAAYQSFVGQPGWTPQAIGEAVTTLSIQIQEIDTRLAASISTSTSARMAAAPSVAAYWDSATLATRRSLLSELVVVTILPGAPRGKRGIDPEYIKLDWKV